MTDDETAPAIEYPVEKAIDRVKFVPRVERAAYEKLRDAVAWLRGKGCPATIELEASRALMAHVTKLERDLNGGREFPPRSNRKIEPGRLDSSKWSAVSEPAYSEPDEPGDQSGG